MMSRSSADEVSTTTGISLVRSSVFSRRSTSRPPSLGIFMSRRTNFGLPPSLVRKSPSWNRYSRASTPSRTRTTLFRRLPLRRALKVSSASASLSSAKRMSAAVTSSIAFSCWQCKREDGSLVNVALSPYAPAVSGNNPVYDRQSHACAFEFVGAVQTLEDTEQFFHVFHVESHAIVLDGIGAFGCGALRAKGDSRLGRLAAIFERVGYE